MPLHPLLVSLLLSACDSAALKAPVGTIVDTLRLTARPGAGMRSLPRPWIEFLLDGIGSRIRIAPPLMLPVFDIAGRKGLALEPGSRPALTDEVRLTVGRDGHVADVALVARSLADEADAALLQAIRSADSTDALVPLPDDGPSRATVFLSLTTREPADTTRPPIDRAARDVSVLSLPVFRDAVSFTPTAGIRGPRYPEAEKRQGIEGAVHLTFVIDETGVVEPSTIRVLRFTSEGFARSVYDALKQMRFNPATIGGCPVKQLVRQPFQFQLTR